MRKKLSDHRRTWMMLEIGFLAVLGWIVLTSDGIVRSGRAAQEEGQNIKSQKKEEKRARRAQKLNKKTNKKQKDPGEISIPVEGPEDGSVSLMALNGTLCQGFDFESGAQGATVVPVFGTGGPVVWHLADSVCRALLTGHSTPHTFYYGRDDTCNYDSGARNASNLVSAPISIAGQFGPFTAGFNYLLFVEAGGFDSTFVDLSTDNGTTWAQFMSKANLINDNQWHHISLDVTTLIGTATSVRLRFRFDSVDNIANATTGWHVDDIEVCGSFNTCIQDDSTRSVLKIDTITGDYQFTNCAGTTLGGTGKVTVQGLLITLQDNRTDRKVLAKIDQSVKKATASIQLFNPSRIFTLTDRNTADNTCVCP